MTFLLAALVFGQAFATDMAGDNGAGSATDSIGRTAILPTAGVQPRGTLSLSLVEVGLPIASYALTDNVELTLGGTWIPYGEALLGVATKVVLDRRDGFTAAGFGGVGVDLPEGGRPGAVPVAGLVSTFDRLSLGDLALRVHFVSLVLLPMIAGSTDELLLIAPTAELVCLPWLSFTGELWLRAIVPEPQAGITGVVAARFRFWRMAADVGWMIDAGIIGPPLPLISLPGAPVLSLTWVL